jgi:hypothetical protein
MKKNRSKFQKPSRAQLNREKIFQNIFIRNKEDTHQEHQRGGYTWGLKVHRIVNVCHPSAKEPILTYTAFGFFS